MESNSAFKIGDLAVISLEAFVTSNGQRPVGIVDSFTHKGPSTSYGVAFYLNNTQTEGGLALELNNLWPIEGFSARDLVHVSREDLPDAEIRSGRKLPHMRFSVGELVGLNVPDIAEDAKTSARLRVRVVSVKYSKNKVIYDVEPYLNTGAGPVVFAHTPLLRNVDGVYLEPSLGWPIPAVVSGRTRSDVWNYGNVPKSK